MRKSNTSSSTGAGIDASSFDPLCSLPTANTSQPRSLHPILFSIKALGVGATRRIQFPKSGHLDTTNTCLHYWTRYLGKVPQLLTLANNFTPPQKNGAHQGTHLNWFTGTSIPPLMALPVKLMVCSTGILASWYQKLNKYLKYSSFELMGRNSNSSSFSETYSLLMASISTCLLLACGLLGLGRGVMGKMFLGSQMFRTVCKRF
jgi:hypothetical protein